MSQKILLAPVKQGELELVSFNTTALLEQIRRWRFDSGEEKKDRVAQMPKFIAKIELTRIIW